MSDTHKALKPPSHLKAKSREWWSRVVQDFELEPHHLMILTAAAEAWDRYQAARGALDKRGMTYRDRFGQEKARPEAQIERDSRAAFLRSLRELSLDIEGPGESNRPPGLPANANRRRG
jgi:P27 family predicted phage terminase small subunit